MLHNKIVCGAQVACLLKKYRTSLVMLRAKVKNRVHVTLLIIEC